MYPVVVINFQLIYCLVGMLILLLITEAVHVLQYSSQSYPMMYLMWMDAEYSSRTALLIFC